MKKFFLISVISFLNGLIISSCAQTKANGHEYVDMGLSVKWATCNVGADKPSDYGSYFAWGETEPKENYTWETYKWCNGSKDSITKYNCEESSSTVDNKEVLDLSDDAAQANWGGSWRMPTMDELKELYDKCSWEQATLNGIQGFMAKSKINGNSIFLPYAGYHDEEGISFTGNFGYYWSSSVDKDFPNYAHSLGLWRLGIKEYVFHRFIALPVRPVIK